MALLDAQTLTEAQAEAMTEAEAEAMREGPWHTITIEGRCVTTGMRGLNVDSTRTIIAEVTTGDEAVAYAFEETEVS